MKQRVSLVGFRVFVFISLAILAALLIASQHDASAPKASSYPEIEGRNSIGTLHKRWKDCSGGIYIDVGTNVGVQVRKLYDPDKFPGASVLPIFDRYFKKHRYNVCAVGFEPNPVHKKYLEHLNDYFARRSLPAFILTETAASSRRGTATFYTNPTSERQHHEWGASLASWARPNDTMPVTVQLIDLQNFIMDFVVPVARRSAKRPPILMKIDVEGAEYVVLPSMIVSGALCHIDLAFVEWHNDNMRLKMPERSKLTRDEILAAFDGLRETHPGCRVNMTDLDDESYVDGTAIPL